MNETTPAERAARQKMIDQALPRWTSSSEKASVLRLGSRNVAARCGHFDRIHFARLRALGVGGFPRGRVVEIFGPESSGKTTLALQVIAQAQKAGGCGGLHRRRACAGPAYARKLGVDVDNLIVSQPDYGEQALEIAGALIGSGGDRRRRGRFRGGAGSQGGTGWRDGRQPHGSARAADVAGAAQADRHAWRAPTRC